MRRKVHFIGVGGAGLSALAHVLHGRGEEVTGSDQVNSRFAKALSEAGVRVSIGHTAENVSGSVMGRREFFDHLTSDSETIAIAGTHGKTTTTGMVAWILDQAGVDPSFIVGGLLPDFGANGKSGKGKYFVVEADEYDNAFLGLHPKIAVITNIEHDHPDIFPTFDDVLAAFDKFAAQVQETLIVCTDDSGAALLSHESVERITYGFDPSAYWRAEDLRANTAGGMDFLVLKGKDLLGLVRTRLPGEHNVSNALAAFAVSDALEIPFTIARDAMTEFHGAGQRFEIIGVVNEITVVDDYAHHPTEIRATLSTSRLRFPEAEIWAVFQPHTYSRIKALLAAFRNAFKDADHVIVTDVFGAREEQNGIISGAFIADEIGHQDVQYIGDFDQIAKLLAQKVQSGDAVVTLSAGDANEVGRLLLQILSGR
jgi:UDP-N-acetylmuramate--alanine ligase